MLDPSTNGLFDIFSKPKEIFSRSSEIVTDPMILLIPSLIWISIAHVLVSILRSVKRSIVLTSVVLVGVTYLNSTGDADTVVIGMSILKLLPAILIGAVLGGFLGWRVFRRPNLEQNLYVSGIICTNELISKGQFKRYFIKILDNFL